MKKKITTNYTENRSGILLIIPMAIDVFVATMFILLFASDPQFSFRSILFISVIAILSIMIFLFFLDELIWQWKGYEELSYTDKLLCIERFHKIFYRRYEIEWMDISEISYRPPHIFFDIITYFSIAGQPQETICIKLKDGKKIMLGVNLNQEQRNNLIQQLNSLQQIYIN